MVNVPDVAIIVLNWNGWKDTLTCLESLQNVTYTRFQIIVVDNGSNDDSIERIKEWISSGSTNPGRYEPVIISTGKNIGYAGGNNAGIRYALNQGFNYVLILNNDTIVDKDFLTPLVQFIETNGQEIGIVGPKVYSQDSSDIIQSVGAEINYWKGKFPPIGSGEVDHGQYNMPRAVDYISGAAMLARREVIDKIGLMDESYFFYVEEVDWCLRARKAGYRVQVVPLSRIWHKSSGSSTLLESPLLLYYKFRNRVLFMRRHGRWYHLLVFMPYICEHLLIKVLSYGIRLRWSHMIALLKGFRDGLFCNASFERQI